MFDSTRSILTSVLFISLIAGCPTSFALADDFARAAREKVDEWDEDDMSQSSQSPGCELVEPDDHGDSLACATPIEPGAAIAAELYQPAAADLDTFSFLLTSHATVVLETLGETDTSGLLLDDAGQVVAADDDGGTDSNFRIVEELCPGVYFVRVEGFEGTEGPYVLTFSTLP